jgi:hypothetical protein
MWIRTDELQWVKRISMNKFEIIDVATHLDNGFYLKHINVDFDNYSEDELKHEISGYYESISQIKDKYGDNDWLQIIAEIIAENEPIDNTHLFFEEKDVMNNYLKKEYGIEI